MSKFVQNLLNRLLNETKPDVKYDSQTTGPIVILLLKQDSLGRKSETSKMMIRDGKRTVK